MTKVNSSVTLKLWHGGLFLSNEFGLTYKGIRFRTVGVDLDELCWFTLLEEAEKCDGFRKDSDAIFYKDPIVGLIRLVDDKGVNVVSKDVVLNRVADCYLVSEKDVGEVMKLIELSKSGIYGQLKKMTPRRKRGPLETLKESDDNNTKKTSLLTSPKSPTKTQRQTTPNSNLKTPQKTQKKPTVVPLRSSPRLASKNASDESPPSFNFNDVRVSDVFDTYEEESDLAVVGDYQWFLGDGVSEDEDEDPGYLPEIDDVSESEGGLSNLDFIDAEGSDDNNEADEVDEGLIEVELDFDENSDDEEVRQARDTIKQWNAKALKIARQVQLQAASGLLPSQENDVSSKEHLTREGFVSDYDESGDEEDSHDESEEESRPGNRKKSKFPVVHERTDFTKLIWSVGIRFPNRETFRDCVIRYAVAQGKNLKVVVSDKGRGKRMRVKCVEGCPFQLYGSWHSKKACFLIKSVQPEHTCRRTMGRNRQLKSSWLANQFLEVFKARPHWPAADIIETVRRAYRVIIKRGYAYKIKYHAHRMLHGSMKEHYGKLGSYMAALQQANPTSCFTLHTTPTTKGPVFQRFFVCFDALKQGWLLGCRKVLCVDACFLKTFLGGQLISAVGRDANEQMYPVAWAVVEGENNESYEWFFQQLKKSLGEKDGDGWTLISDEHPSILTMVAKEFPKAEHRHCARHIFANWHKSYRGDEFKMMFWQCAKAYNEADFNDALEAMREVDPKAADAFVAYRPQLFCRAFVKTATKNDVIVSNMAETWNAYIINARAKHLLYMLEDIRVALMQRMVTKKKEMEKKSGQLCPKVQEKLEKEKEVAASCTTIPSSDTVFQVKHTMDDLTVDLQAKTCTCRKWDLTGIPCCHAVAAIFYMEENPEDYVYELYRRDTYIKIYSSSVPPCPGERHWPQVVLPLSPPPIKVGPGRPRKNRRKDPFEDPKRSGKLTRHGLEMSCSICRSKTHNKRKCPQKDHVAEPPPKRGRGRPRGVASSSTTSVSHHDVTAQPTRVGRGGRVIGTGRGGRGGSRGGAKGGTRGGKNRVPSGAGVLFDGQGNVFTNDLGNPSGPQSLVSVEKNATLNIPTQASVNH